MSGGGGGDHKRWNGNLISTMSIKDFEFTIKLKAQKVSDIEDETASDWHKFFGAKKKNKKGKEYSSLYETSITLILKSDKYVIYEKKNYRPVLPMNI